MKATILIVGEGKEKYLNKTIKSCLNQTYKNYEIILIFSYLNNLKFLKNNFKSKVRYLKVSKQLNPLRDQFFKIKQGLKCSKGDFIFLLDGDDEFKKNKLKEIISLKNKNHLIMDDHIIFKNNNFIYKKNNFYKNNLLYQIFFNPWPDKVCTSCISGSKKLFQKFFKSFKMNNINFVAIDILLIIFFLKKTYFQKKVLTIKKILDKSIDKNYSDKFTKIYWRRRIEQHIHLKKIHKKYYSLEFFFSKLVLIIFDFHKYIRKIF